MPVGEIVDKRHSAPPIEKFNPRADIDQVVPGQLPVRAGELVRAREKNRVARAGVYFAGFRQIFALCTSDP
jgi:hypothetical protein